MFTITKIKMNTLLLAVILAIAGAACSNNVTVLNKRAPFETPARQGDAQAQYQLGRTYCCGVGAGYDDVIARQWFCKSAMQGHGGAQYQLGRMLGERMDSHSTPSKRENLIEAYMWYSLAALQQIPLAAAERDALKVDLRPQELRESEERIRRWQTWGCE